MPATEDFRAIIDEATDGSRLHNVVGTLDQGAAGQLAFNIGCTSRRAAMALAAALNDAAWIEVEPQDYVDPEPRAKTVDLYDPEDAADELACRRERLSERPATDEGEGEPTGSPYWEA